MEEDTLEEELNEPVIEEDEADDDAFAKGYKDEDEVLECAECGGAVKEGKKVIRAIAEEDYTFCCKECADDFQESLE